MAEGRTLLSAAGIDPRCLEPGALEGRAPLSGASLRQREEKVAEWSAALLGVLQAAQVPRSGAGIGVEESPEWRRSDGALTPGKSQTNTAGKTVGGDAIGAEEASEGELNQVRLEVNVGRLGTIALAVERGTSGLRLVLSAAHQATRKLLESECRALQQSLTQGGLLVESIRFVTMNGDGPNVASGRIAVSKRFAKSADCNPEAGSSPKRKPRRLNAVG